MTPVIQATGLSKTYGTTKAVVDLNLLVHPGEVFAFLGPNGAGKSTTIRMLLDLQQPSAGSARVFGLDAHRDAVEIHRRIGYLPGDLELYPRLTGRHLIDWFARARGSVDRAYTRELTERFDVVLDRPVRSLSKGNRQKIGLVLAVMHRPELLILDEPTSGLDPLMQNEFERLVRETVADGRTVFLSSHELDEVQRLADRVAIIKAGRLVANDTIASLVGAMPQHLEARFTTPVDRAAFASLAGVQIASCVDGRIALDVVGPIAPVLRLLAEHDPVDLVSRPSSLDELFLDLYRTPSIPAATSEHADAH